MSACTASECHTELTGSGRARLAAIPAAEAEKAGKAEGKIKETIEDYQKGKLELLPGMDAYQTVETLILRQLNQLRDKIGENVFLIKDGHKVSL